MRHVIVIALMRPSSVFGLMHSMILQCACPFLGHRKTHIDVSRYALRNSRNEQPVWGCFIAEANAAQANKAIEEPFLVDSLNLLEHSG